VNSKIPLQELTDRWDRCRSFLEKFAPASKGLFIFSRLNIYYFSGSFVSGLFWLPPDSEPILFCRRGIERAKIESAVKNIFPFNSYRDIEDLLKRHNFTLPKIVAAEMNGLSWALANSLLKHFSSHEFIPGDKCIAHTRARKSEWELDILRKTGVRHAECLIKLLPPFLHPGISELEIAHKMSDLFYSKGHQGILRMENYGEQLFLGHISIGESANYPSAFNGPVGLRGVHPAIPYMGSEEIKWNIGEPLIIDCGFTIEGYQTDKTQVYWLGNTSSIPADVQEAHDFCIEMQNRIAEQLRPGALPSEIWDQCISLSEKSRWDTGFMGLGKNKVNFVGHGIGLAIDEYPVLAKNFDSPLEEGMVLAIEPKIAIPEVGMVGVENTFEVTKYGGKCITGDNFNIINIPV
jgi:Xaa-Pro dipeptidase